MSPVDKGRVRELYEQVAPVLAIVIMLTAFSALGWSWQNSRADARQDRAALAENARRDAERTQLLDCFDRFATDLAGGLPPVREATAQANDALARALGLLGKGLAKVGAGTFDEADLRGLIAAFDDYQRANDHLAQVRADNPYPSPPSTFCTQG